MWASACVASGLLLCNPVMAVSTENLLFLEAWRGVDRAYVDKSFNNQNWLQLREKYLRKESMNSRKQTYEAIEKMLATLNDPFTRFLDPSKYSAVKGGTEGIVTGVGLEVAYASDAKKQQELVVIAPAPKSPAFRAGIQPGDVLLQIDGAAINNESLYVIGDRLRGDKGSEVSLTVRKKSGQIETLTLTREKVIFNPVIYKTCTNVPNVKSGANGTLGYIQVLRFTSQTARDVEEAIKSLQVPPIPFKQSPKTSIVHQSKGVDRYLLDLRNNGGGSFPAGVDVSRMLLDKGDIVLIADTEGVRDIVSSEGPTLDSTTPLTVIVNRGTASAAEVLSGALQDSGRGVIIGESSFGKGLIQTLIPLSDGSALAVTTAKYQTPSGKDINGTGIQPDITLPSNIDVPFGDDGQFCDHLKAAEGEVDLFKS